MRIAIENCAVAPMNGTVHADGHVVVDGNRIVAVGAGPAREPGLDRRIDGSGCLATPGLVNCHHHLYQWSTRGRAQDATLFQWLEELYPVWARIDERVERACARAGLATLLRSGCTTAADHHYVFPRDGGDLFGVEVEAARALGIRFNPARGSMDLGQSAGGLPPDSICEDRDTILAAYDDVLARFHDPSPGSMCRVALAPCSPFSVTRELMVESAELARARGVRLHTHLAETRDEEEFCLAQFGMRPVQYLEECGWLGADVWLAHCVHLDDAEVTQFARTGTGVAHCPSSNARLGAGIAPVVDLVRRGGTVGLGVDGAASNEGGELAAELRQALYSARLRGGPDALGAHDVLELATRHGARCLGREDELGSLEPGKLADVALWRLDGLDRAGIRDPVVALVFSAPRLADLVMVNGEIVVEDGELRTADVDALARELAEVAL
jgi:cytosine/adenosine deaminase-related metal-dependent hydrolase